MQEKQNANRFCCQQSLVQRTLCVCVVICNVCNLYAPEMWKVEKVRCRWFDSAVFGFEFDLMRAAGWLFFCFFFRPVHFEHSLYRMSFLMFARSMHIFLISCSLPLFFFVLPYFASSHLICIQSHVQPKIRTILIKIWCSLTITLRNLCQACISFLCVSFFLPSPKKIQQQQQKTTKEIFQWLLPLFDRFQSVYFTLLRT